MDNNLLEQAAEPLKSTVLAGDIFEGIDLDLGQDPAPTITEPGYENGKNLADHYLRVDHYNSPAFLLQDQMNLALTQILRHCQQRNFERMRHEFERAFEGIESKAVPTPTPHTSRTELLRFFSPDNHIETLSRLALLERAGAVVYEREGYKRVQSPKPWEAEHQKDLGYRLTGQTAAILSAITGTEVEQDV